MDTAHRKPRIIPVCEQFRQDSVACNSPEEAFRLFQDSTSFILESAYGEDKRAQYSLIGLHPVLRITAGNDNRTLISGLSEYLRPLLPLFSGDPQSISSREIPAGGVRRKEPSESANDPVPSGCNGMETMTIMGQDPVSVIHRIPDMFEYHGDTIPGYQGGMTGFFSYDLVYSLFRKVTTEKPELAFPLADFIMTSEYILFDHPTGELYIFSLAVVPGDDDAVSATEHARQKVCTILEQLRTGSPECSGKASLQETVTNQVNHTNTSGDLREAATKAPPPEYSTNISKEEYEDLVRRTKEYIFSGDIFQGVVSRQIGCAYQGDPFLIYSALRRINPGPYMYYIDYGERQIIGSSPEMLVRVEKNRVTTVPIAGTRARGATPEEDVKLEHELLSDEKECAEHLMLVDLARNDIGRVSEYGTVNVDEFMKIEKFSHVQHIVSTVSGILKEGYTPADAFTSCFPAGTLTGAPKIRAMQIIGELESVRRGLYGGAVGHIGLDGKTDFAIAIRTLISEQGRLTFRTGAGIVADSDPETEYFETEKKAFALAQAITLAKGGDVQ